MNKHEIQAEINARDILLRQTQEATIAHLEATVGALLAKLDPADRDNVLAELSNIETLSPETHEIVVLHGETDPSVKSKRQLWREERAALVAQLESAPDAGDGEA